MSLNKALAISAVAFSLILQGCVQGNVRGSGDLEIKVIEGASNIVAQQIELEKPSLSLDRVMILRMTINGERADVSSLVPGVIVAEPNRGNRTIMNLSDRKKLVLFTRDGLHIKGYRSEIPVEQLTAGRTFVFPVAQNPGEVVDKTFVVEKLVEQ
ncbi:MAG TPA: hypothetical protein VI279_06950 [Rhodocyclaceae bacterium]